MPLIVKISSFFAFLLFMAMVVFLIKNFMSKESENERMERKERKTRLDKRKKEVKNNNAKVETRRLYTAIDETSRLVIVEPIARNYNNGRLVVICHIGGAPGGSIVDEEEFLATFKPMDGNSSFV